MDIQLAGKRALVTGSSSGIGRAIAAVLAQEGVIVFVHGRDATRAEETAASIVASGGRAELALGDLGTDEGTASVLKSVEARLGGVDILVNNAGGSSRDGWGEAQGADWITAFNLNVVSAVRLINGLAPAMRSQGWGRIVQIASVAAVNPPPVMAAYGAVKAALANLTVSLAKELAGTGVTVNTISPGPTLTEGWRRFALDVAKAQGLGEDFASGRDFLLNGPLKTPSNRIALPEEVAALVALVVSPLSASINGANFRIDGGFAPTVN
jgi:NAD(P)-dependent dehydrogenase (short-subunit alcohol dehydrogenase family)